MSAGGVRLRGLVKSYDGLTRAVDGLDLEIAGGEFFALLGESGCGKTTTLRLIAGFEAPDEGEILLDDADLVAVPAHQRPVNTVFQSYALFPFLSVAENVGFGLKYAGVTGPAAATRIGRALELVELGKLAGRKPHQLSGGQQQRVALARALVLEPKVLLLDEPLGALDARLRSTLQAELRALQRAVRTTFVYVTHDQDEALTMSDRLAVMVDGRVEQVGSPDEVYDTPSSAYVANFLGSANLWPAVVESVSGSEVRCRVGEVTLTASENRASGHSGQEVQLMVRPERVGLCAEGTRTDDLTQTDGTTLAATVDSVTYRGARSTVRLTAGGLSVEAEVPHTADRGLGWAVAGTRLSCRIPSDSVRVLYR
ncbi:MAG: ABC transporter ATP-binding protein [Nocardioides sp.]